MPFHSKNDPNTDAPGKRAWTKSLPPDTRLLHSAPEYIRVETV